MVLDRAPQIDTIRCDTGHMHIWVIAHRLSRLISNLGYQIKFVCNPVLTIFDPRCGLLVCAEQFESPSLDLPLATIPSLVILITKAISRGALLNQPANAAVVVTDSTFEIVFRRLLPRLGFKAMYRILAWTQPFPAFLRDVVGGFLQLLGNELIEDGGIEDEHTVIALGEQIAPDTPPAFS